jgi:hypothetical protein
VAALLLSICEDMVRAKLLFLLTKEAHQTLEAANTALLGLLAQKSEIHDAARQEAIQKAVEIYHHAMEAYISALKQYTGYVLSAGQNQQVAPVQGRSGTERFPAGRG